MRSSWTAIAFRSMWPERKRFYGHAGPRLDVQVSGNRSGGAQAAGLHHPRRSRRCERPWRTRFRGAPSSTIDLRHRRPVYMRSIFCLMVARTSGTSASGGSEAASLELSARQARSSRPVCVRLDPAPDVAFSAVIDAAKRVRDILELLGLTSFCKTTGGKGLHIVTPLALTNDVLTGRLPRNLPATSAPRSCVMIHSISFSTCRRKNAPDASSSIICATTEWRPRWRRSHRARGRTRRFRCLLPGHK